MTAGPAARPEAFVASGRVGLEPVRALPAGLLAERRSELDEARIGRGQAERPTGLPLLVRVVDVVVGRVDLDGPGQGVGLAAVLGAEATDVHLPEVELGLAVDDPGRDLPPDPPGAGDSVGAEPGRDEEPADGALAEDELVVRGEPLGSVDHPADPGVTDRRDPADGPVHDLLEARPVGCQETAVEVGRDPVEGPRCWVALVAAHAQPADLLPEVDQVVGVAHRRQRRRHAVDPLSEQVLVGHRDDRNVDPCEPADLRGEHAARVDHDLGPDRPLLAVLDDPDPGHPAVGHVDRGHPRPGLDPDPPSAGAGGERLGEARRVEPAVGRQVDGAEHAVERHQREEGAGLTRADELKRQPERLRPAGLAGELLEPLRRRGQAERADLVPGRVDAGLGRESPVELDPVHHHPGQGHARPELADEAGRVERRARRQLGALDEDDVRPAKLGEVVGDARPADTAADDHRPCVVHPVANSARRPDGASRP